MPEPKDPPRWGFTKRHDRALDWCITHYGRCPFGCAKDGAPNCFHNVANNECQPAQMTVEETP